MGEKKQLGNQKDPPTLSYQAQTFESFKIKKTT